MKTSGNFNYYLDNESKTIEEIMHLVTSDMTVSIRGLDVLYFSPKKENKAKLDKATKQLELEDLRSYLINDNSTPKDLAEIASLITAENEDELCQRFSEIKLKNYKKEKNFDEIIQECCDRVNKAVGFNLATPVKKTGKNCKCSANTWREKENTKKEVKISPFAKVYDTDNKDDLKELEFLGFSAQKEKTEELLKETEEYQKQNGGILQGVEFPFDDIQTDWIDFIGEGKVFTYEYKKENKQKSFNLGNNTETVTSEILKQESNKQNKGVIKDSFEGWYNTPLGKKSLKDITPSRKHIEKLGSINYNRPFSICNSKEEDMNRLVEEELERQEQQIFKDCNSSGTGEVFKNTEFINSTGGIINPSGTTFGLDINKPHPFFENEDLAQETAEQIKQAIKEKNDKPQLSWKFIEEMAKRMTNNKSNGIITKEVLEEFKNTNFAFKLYEVLAGKQINNTVIGKKENNDKPQISILFTQFPKALEAITKCSEYGHLKYKETDTDYLNYQRVEGGSKAYADAGLRHRLYKKGTTDIESQLPHYYHVAWNALAELELLIKENSK